METKFILPAIIDERKAILLNLSQLSGLYPEAGVDTYVIGWTGARKELIRLSKDHFIQSLTMGHKDYEIGGLQVTASNNGDQVIIELTPHAGAGVTGANVAVTDATSLACFSDEYSINFSLFSNASSSATASGKLDVVLVFHVSDISYASSLRFYYAPEHSIKEAGLDFGSEACQIMEGPDANGPADLFDLYASMKKHYGSATDANDSTAIKAEQFDGGHQRLYRSIFYMTKGVSLDDPGNIQFQYISKFSSVAALNQHLRSWQLIPNLKLIANSSAILNEFPRDLQQYVYKRLLESIIKSYVKSLKQRQYLRFTLLVPNIYDIKQVAGLQRMVRGLLVNEFQGVEVGVISESDAAFLGTLGRLEVQPGHYYIIVDCGKGTTDFSVVEVDSQTQCKTTYRNGFAGAGNLITFAFMESLLHFLKDFPGASPQAKEVFKNNILDRLSDDYFIVLRRNLFNFCERSKMKYDPSMSVGEATQNWVSNFPYDEIFAPNALDNVDSFDAALRNCNLPIADWADHIANTYEHIAHNVSNQLNFVYTTLAKKKIQFGGIVFSGRGFAFRPLAESMRNHLLQMEAKVGLLGRNNSRITEGKFSQENGENLKLVAIRGIFNRSIIHHTDIISTPVETNVVDLGMRSGTPPKTPGLFEKIKSLLFGEERIIFSPEQNRLQVVHIDDMHNVRFVAGSTTYFLNRAATAPKHAGCIVQSREGFYFVEYNLDGEVVDSTLLQIDGQANLNADPSVAKSLFPRFLYKEYLFKKF